MKKTIVIALSLLLALPSFAASKESKDNAPVKEHLQNHFKFYGFIRNFFAFDTRESTAGTGDLFYYLPKDQKLNELGDDLNAMPSFRFLALTSRVGVDVSGYQVGSTSFGAKFEADFYSGLSSSATSSKINGAAQLRLRQAYVTIGWKDLPMSGDAKAAVSFFIFSISIIILFNSLFNISLK